MTGPIANSAITQTAKDANELILTLPPCDEGTLSVGAAVRNKIPAPALKAVDFARVRPASACRDEQISPGAAMKALHVLVLIVAMSIPSVAFASHTYQATGPVLEVNDKTFTIQKGKEKWEFDRSPDTKIDGELKVGEKVTVYYHMTAEKVEASGKDAKK
jgi:hypothetical protein